MTQRTDYTDLDNIEALISALSDPDGEKREETRVALVAVGPAIILVLTGLITNPNHHVRWEVAKALGEINHPDAAPALVTALGDSEMDIRWLGGEGLLALGRAGVEPLLQELTQRGGDLQLRQGAHHVVREMLRRGRDPYLATVLDALEGPAAEDSVPPAALRALEILNSL